MLAFNLKAEENFYPKHHVEKILGTAGEGDVGLGDPRLRDHLADDRARNMIAVGGTGRVSVR